MIGLPFSPAMAVAACAGRKTQTRRLSGLEVVNAAPDKWHLDPIVCPSGARIFQRGFDTVSCKPRYHVGQRVCLLTEWAVSENFDCDRPTQILGAAELWHAGMGPKPEHGVSCLFGISRRGRFLPNHLRPLMPVFEITGVKCERVQDISEADAVAEGVERNKGAAPWTEADGWLKYPLDEHLEDFPAFTAKESFHTLWDSINAKKGFGWQVNNWNFPYSFKLATKEPAP